MQYIDFKKLADYFQNKINMVVYNLQESGALPQIVVPTPDNLGVDRENPYDNENPPEHLEEELSYRFAYYINDGDYHKAVKEANNIQDKERPVIPVLIKNGGGVQDNSTPLDIYLQKLEFEIYGWCDRNDELRDQWDDVELIFSKFCAEMKNRVEYMDGNTLQIDASDYPVLNELENRHFVGFLNVNVHVIFGAHLSNMDKVKINNVEIPYLNFNETLTVEMLSDNKKTTMVKFLPNVSLYQIAITGLYDSNNSVVNLLVEGCTTGALYAQPFGVEIVRDGKVLANRTMYVKEFRTLRSFGSIVAYSVSFYPSYIGA